MLIDLSLVIDEQDKNNPFFNQKEGIAVARIGHLGTHIDLIDVPADQLELDRFIRTGKIVHVENIYDRPIEPANFAGQLPIAPGDLVVFKTDWFANCYATEFYLKGRPDGSHPELSDATLDYLIERRVSFIGIDAAGVKKMAGHPKADTHCAAHNVFVIENVVNLDKMPQDRFKAYCFPLNLKNSSGLPMRLVAEV